MWTNFIDQILIKDLGFETTAKDRWFNIKRVEGNFILPLCQGNDFCYGFNDEQDAKNINAMIETKIKFQSERDKGVISFEYLGLVKD